jgi:iron complex transport system ATP-binding protein
MKLVARSIAVTAGGRAIVQGASLEVGPGELVGLIGPNGAGKSTLLKAILTLRPRIGGTVSLDERAIETIPPRERARWVAYLAQEGRVEWRLRARDVVALGRRPHLSRFGGPGAADAAAVGRAIAAVEAEDFADRPVAVLSGGERARVLLARALAVEAPLLLADEPTAALDPYHQLHVMEILRAEAARGAGVLIVLHDLALAARFMDRVVVMSGGEVVAEGPPAAVLDDATLASVYRIAVARGREGGSDWVVPWSRRAGR